MRRRALLGAVGGATVLGGSFLGWELFAPERAMESNEDRIAGTGDGDGSSDGDGSDAGDGGGDSSSGGGENGGNGGDASTDDTPASGDAEATGDGTESTAGDDGDSSGGATVLERGTFEGKDGHDCSGTVELARDDAGAFLQFRDFRMTQGPDVYCYVTPAPDPDTSEAIDAGTKVRIDGGAEDGELTKTGTFAQSLPDGFDVDAAAGVGAWCDDFSVAFGAATLREV